MSECFINGFNIKTPTTGGKAGKGKNKTSTVQVLRGGFLVKQFRYNVIEFGSYSKAFEKAKDYARNNTQLRAVRVHFNNGDYLVTNINGTEQSIRNYYIGNQFNIGTGGNDLLVTAVRVDFVDTDN